MTTGAQFSYSGTNTAPTSFSINGTACTGAHQAPIAVLTSPQPGAVYSQGELVPLAATAAAADNATITKVEFYYEHHPAGHRHQRPLHALRRQSGRGQPLPGGEGVRQPGRVGEFHPGRHHRLRLTVVASPTQLGVRQGTSGTFEVKLSKQPTANVTVTTARASELGPLGQRRRDDPRRRTGTPRRR
ncbi:Cellulose 1,4-beta-cellobiosidase OS=Streptomyces fumanus OX=67302 GN=GCM10018772_58810 PE=4 SV=1 [Streptomyces fumanus]